MTYEVELLPRVGVLDLAEVRAWLDSEPRWSFAGNSAMYGNEDTGVDFILDLVTGSGQPSVIGVLNVNRPSFYGLEYAEVLAGLVTRFGLLMSDLQDDDSSFVEFSREQLLSGWDAENAHGYRVFNSPGAATPGLPRAVLVEAWNWNWNREVRQAELGEAVFVPKIMPIQLPDGVATAVVWTDAIPFTLPPVGFVIVFRNELAPSRLFRRSSGIPLLTRSEVVAGLEPFAVTREDRVDFLEITPTAPVREWVRKLKPSATKFGILPWDHVLDAELLAR